MFTGTGANVDNPVAFPNGVFIVFNNQHRVAEVSQPNKGFNESLVVSLMKAN